MANTDRCPRCGALVLPTERFCPQCGAPLEGAKAAEDMPPAGEGLAMPAEGTPLKEGEGAGSAPREAEATAMPAESPATAAPAAASQSGPPRTIEALQAFCRLNEMPLEKMRFFIGEDYRQPRAFGIYRDGDNFVVYKNKADGSRAVRYHGPDEGWAVKELYDKLLDECHARNIWPGGKPKAVAEAQRKAKRRSLLIIAAMAVLIFGIAAFVIVSEIREHRADGYYRFGYDDTYYRYGDTWYYYDVYDDWVAVDDYPYYEDYGDYYLGDDYDRAWGGSDFKSSDTWEDIQEREHTSSSDYDSWDSGGTDWDSDW